MTGVPAEAIQAAARKHHRLHCAACGLHSGQACDGGPAELDLAAAEQILRAAEPHLAGQGVPTVAVKIEGGDLTEAQLNKLRDRLRETWREQIASRDKTIAEQTATLNGLWAERDRMLGQLGECTDRINALEQLAGDVIASYHRGSDGYRGRVGQVQIARWQAVIDG